MEKAAAASTGDQSPEPAANRRGGEGGRPLRAKGAALASQLPCRPGVCRTTSHAFNLLYRRWQAEAHPIPLYEYQRWTAPEALNQRVADARRRWSAPVTGRRQVFVESSHSLQAMGR